MFEGEIVAMFQEAVEFRDDGNPLRFIRMGAKCPRCGFGTAVFRYEILVEITGEEFAERGIVTPLGRGARVRPAGRRLHGASG